MQEISTPDLVQISELKVSIDDLPVRTTLALFIGFLVTEQKVPTEIIVALDKAERRLSRWLTHIHIRMAEP